jgi:hypothetical protein
MGKVNSILPRGYTQFEELSVTTGRYRILLDIEKGGSVSIYKVEMSFKWFDADSTKRQLIGFERDPWFGCDKGVFKGTLTINSTPAINTQIVANTWYDIVYEASCRNGYDNQKFSLFTLEGYPQYQSYGSIKNDFKVYRNDELVGHYITCTNPSDVYGVFNTVTQTFCPLTSY